MQSDTTSAAPPGLVYMALGDGTPLRAAATAAIVGTILTAINHGDVIVAGSAPAPVKVFLTYCVPYCVTTWGAIIGKRAQWKRDHGIS